MLHLRLEFRFQLYDTFDLETFSLNMYEDRIKNLKRYLIVVILIILSGVMVVMVFGETVSKKYAHACDDPDHDHIVEHMNNGEEAFGREEAEFVSEEHFHEQAKIISEGK